MNLRPYLFTRISFNKIYLHLFYFQPYLSEEIGVTVDLRPSIAGGATTSKAFVAI